MPVAERPTDSTHPLTCAAKRPLDRSPRGVMDRETKKKRSAGRPWSSLTPPPNSGRWHWKRNGKGLGKGQGKEDGQERGMERERGGEIMGKGGVLSSVSDGTIKNVLNSNYPTSS